MAKRPEPEQITFLTDEEWPIPDVRQNVVEIGSLPSPIWTETKAKLISDYLRFFLFITRHGTYIDGFSGPQYRDATDAWAAKLVVEMTPKWLRDFYLCELNKASFEQLQEMLDSQETIRGRTLSSHCGDFNEWVNDVLRSKGVTDSKATFALLDQRSCECHWATVEKLANYKKVGRKIELFYFFGTSWIHRSIKGFADTATLNTWWGDDGWGAIQNLNQSQAASLMADKIRGLGYRDVKAWPITQREKGQGRTMYHMIHATDHDEAPRLMYRAYRKLVAPPEVQEQMTLLENENFLAE